ncbi:MAG: prolipoprotein diacylglyceryl transferase [Xanthomonadales bacterium]|nr:Prolipoprotein diacylglyceryl transferase [Xanthomonadales bacterium]MCC6593027.1 prolipoprotein diacylglyceryl transferase [Xanthomonadales bacterium]MCE7931069.1 prolipoprotein diacylglyceryl transferase [Xanthomonadales bacterium PRO6]
MPYVHAIDPVALQIGPLAIRWYGLMYLAGGVAAFVLARRRAAQTWRGFQPGEIEDIIFYGMVGVIVGGRLGSVLFYHFGDFLRDPPMLVRVWEGGMSFHGGLLGVLVALGWYARKTGRTLFAMYDFIAPMVPIGLGLGRIGNWIGGELWGRLTDVPWGVIFPNALPGPPMSIAEIQALAAQGQLLGEVRHPSQLYQAFWEGVVLFVIVWWFSARPRARMATSGLFLIVYGVGRILVEFVREPDAHIGYLAWGWLTMGQVLSLPMLLVGVWFLWVGKRNE